MKTKIKQTLTTTAKVAFAAALIYWMIRKGAIDFDVFMRLATPLMVTFGVVATFGQIFINNYRWLCLMRGQGFESSVRLTMPLSLIGMFFNFVMPGGVGGDVIKGYYLLQQHPKQKFAAAVSIFMDRVMGFFVMSATAFFALFLNWQAVARSHELRAIALGVAGLFIGFLVFFFISLSKVLQKKSIARILFDSLPGGQKLRRIYDTLHSYHKAPSALVMASALSLGNIGIMVVFCYVVGLSMGVTELPFSMYCFLVPIGVIVQALPISPAGIGVGQAAFFFLFNLSLGKESQIGPTAITTMQILQFVWGIVGAFFYLQRKKPVLEPAAVEVSAGQG